MFVIRERLYDHPVVLREICIGLLLLEARHIPKALVSDQSHSNFKLDPTKTMVQNNLGYQLLKSKDYRYAYDGFQL